MKKNSYILNSCNTSKMWRNAIAFLIVLLSFNSIIIPVRAVSESKEIVFIDSEVKDIEALKQSVLSGVEVVTIDSKKDGLNQIADFMANSNSVDAIHIISHGAEGQVFLGNSILSLDNIKKYNSQLQIISKALNKEGEIILYGCNIAHGDMGERFINSLKDITEVNVMASTDDTGSEALGGNWILEVNTGEANVVFPFVDGFKYDSLLRATETGVSPTYPIFVRPGGISSSWSFGYGTTPNPSYPGSYPVIGINYHNVPDPGFGWILTRGYFQYSTNGGAAWNTYTLNTNVSTNGTLWRFVDTTPNDKTTSNTVGVYWTLQSAGSLVSSSMNVHPDNEPTDVTSDKNNILDDAITGDTIAALSKVDTGLSTGGLFVLENQSVPNLFTLVNDSVAGTATLKLGTGVIPPIGQKVTANVRYYDPYQLDTNNNPIAGQGFLKTLEYTIVSGKTKDLSFTDDLKVNTTTAKDQINPAVVTLSNNNFVSVWQSVDSAGNNNIYGQIYDSVGVKVGSEFAVTTSGSGVDNTNPVVMALNNGRFVVSYMTTGSNGIDIGYKLIEDNGTVGTQNIANTTLAEDQTTSAIATLSDGSFMITWVSKGNVYAQKFNASDGSKNGTELTINSTAADLINGPVFVNPTIGGLSNGGYVVAWGDAFTGNIFFKVNGGAEDKKVNTDGGSWSAEGMGPRPRIASFPSGGFALTWDSYANDLTSWSVTDIFVNRYDNTGTLQGSTIQANATSTGFKFNPSIVVQTNGGFVVTWQSDTNDYDLNGIFGRRFSSNGTPTDTIDFEINQYRRGNQINSVVTALPLNRFAVVWNDINADTTISDIEGRVLLTNNAPVLNDTVVTLNSISPTITTYPTGAVGTLVSEIVSLSKNVSDADNGAVTGIALTATDNTHGIWFFSLDNGSTWWQVGNVSASNALLLRPTDRLYFKPDGVYSGGIISQGITFRAWDQAAGIVGDRMNTAVNNGGDSSVSLATDTASIDVSNGIAPAIGTSPSDVTIYEGNNTSFTVVATGTGLTYKWQVNKGSGFTNISNGGFYSGVNAETLNIIGATVDMNGYVYRVEVTGTVAPTAISNSATLSVVSTLKVPGDPTNLTTTAANGRVTVKFTAPANDGGSAITGYKVKVYLGTTLIKTVDVTKSPAAITGLTNGTAYTFKVSAVNLVGEGTASVETAAVTPSTIPGAVTGVVATVTGSGQVTVSFTPPANNGGSAITQYIVTSDIGGITQTGTGSPIVITGLTSGKTYKFVVKAKNAAGTSTAVYSNSVTISN